MLDDLILLAAMLCTVGFAVAVFSDNDTAAAWLAGGLAALGIVRVILIIRNAASDY